MIFNFKMISFLLGNVIFLFGVAEAIPLLYAFATVTKGSAEFLICDISIFILGFLLKTYGLNNLNKRLTIKDMFLFTSIVWILIVVIAAFPIALIEKTDIITACFETASAISTTGITLLSNIDQSPPSLLLWRSILQYMGGIGFIAMGIAILPNLNVGGMKLFQTENSSQAKDTVTPKSKTLAKGILFLYLAITIIAIITYKLLGMNLFDAVNHALTSVATGGMSTHSSSMNFFPKSIHWATICFMFLGSLPFALMFLAIKEKNIIQIFKDQQVKGFIFIIFITTAIVTIDLIVDVGYDFEHAVRISLFNVINILSSTGYSLEDYSNYNNLITMIFLIILPLGACSGSTSGGLKIFRIQIALTLFKRQIHQLMHPSAIFPQQYNNTNVNDTIIRSIIAFFFSYLVALIISSTILCATNMNIMDSLSLSLTCLSNIGPGIGPTVGPNGDLSFLSTFQKILLISDMMLGRLEILTIIICLTPSFWKI
ncbi:MAG: TrkH family potassium uptake protein [Succinivibrionaceae bacterium]